MKETKKQLNVYVRRSIIAMIDEISMNESRGDCIARLVDKEYKLVMRKRALQFPTLAQVEAAKEIVNGNER